MSALNRLGLENIVCTYHHGRDVPDIETQRISPINRYRNTDAGPNPAKYFADIKLLLLVVRSVRRFRPDVIHGHLHEGVLIGWLGRLLAFRWKTTLVADIQGSLVGELQTFNYFGRSRVLLMIFWVIEYLIVRLPQHIFCSSAMSSKLLHSKFRIPDEKITLIHDAVELEMFEDSELPVMTLPTSEQDVVVIYTGSLLPGKGLSELCAILSRLLMRRSDVHALVVGYPTEVVAEQLAGPISEGRVTLTGRVSYTELPHYLAAADIALEPKDADSGEASGKVIHYMAAGLPVVGFDTQNNRALIGNDGSLARRGSIDDFVRHVELLADDAELRHARGAAARHKIEQGMSWEQGGRSIYAVLDDLVLPAKQQ